MRQNLRVKLRIEQMEFKTIACFFDADVEHFDYMENTLKNYDIGRYAIAHEQNPRPHFHFIFEGTDQIYNNLSKVIVEKFNLRRKGRGGVIKYGKVKNLRDQERMLIYTVKDGNFRSNYEPEYLRTIFEQSFKKTDKKKELDKMVEYLDSNHHPLATTLLDGHHAFSKPCPIVIRDKIVRYMLKNDLRLNRNSILSNINYYHQHSTCIDTTTKVLYFSSLVNFNTLMN